MHISSVEGVNDMILLGDLKESAILHNLHMRYKEDKIYVSLCWIKSRSNELKFLFRHLRVRFWLLLIRTNYWTFTISNQCDSTVTRKLANCHHTYSRSVTMPIGICNVINTINVSLSVEKVAVEKQNQQNWFFNFLRQRVDNIRGSNNKFLMLIQFLKVNHRFF